MGKAGYLPDISSAFSFWREFAVNNILRKEWKGAESALYNINSLLDSAYVVKVNTREYKELIKNNTYWKCGACGEKTPQSEIKVFDAVLPIVKSMITGNNTESTWFCVKCKSQNLEIYTIKIIEEIDQPSYRKCVQSPPILKIGLYNRMVYETEFKAWFYNFLEELQHQLSLYRVEYVGQHGHDMVDSGYVDKGDE